MTSLNKQTIWFGTSQWLVAVLFYGVEWLQRVAPTLLVAPMMHHYHLSAAMIAAIFSLYYWVYAIMQLPAGVLLDHYGPRKMLTIAATLLTVGTISYVFSNSIIGLCLARLLVGVGSAFGFIGCLKVAKMRVTQRVFPMLVSLTNSIGMLGALAGMTPLSHLIAAWGWQRSLLFASLVSLFMAALLWCVLSPDDVAPRCSVVSSKAWKKPWINLLVVAKNPLIWVIGLYAGLMQIPVIAYAELWAVPFLHVYQHLSNVMAALVNSYVFWGIFIGGFFWGTLMGLPVLGRTLKSGSRRYLCLLIAHIGVFACLVSLLFYHHRAHALEGLSFGLGFFTVVMLISYTWASELAPPKLTASSVALVNMIGVIIGAAFQWVMSVFIKEVHHVIQFRHAFFPMIVSSVVAFMLVIWILWYMTLRSKSHASAESM